ncbi:hypothetical protein [Dactylosporangium sp. CA-139066]|uniref:hypothetical protein n=1 Tax=Dactylosporangium sp. CA-139066 TaxID=3239930 RepID=UPI003D8A0275
MSIAPISPVEQPEAATPQPASVPRGREALFALLVAVVVAALGAPFGWLWSKLAPHVELVQTQYGPYPLQPEPEGYWADDGWFILMSLGMGAIVAVAAWFLLRRYRGPVLLAAVVLGSIGASVLAAWLGNKIGWSHYIDQAEHAPVDTHIFRPVKLRSGSASLAFGFVPWVRGTMLIQGLAAAAIYTGLAGFHASPTLRYDNMPPEYLGPPAPSAYPPPPGEYPPADDAYSTVPAGHSQPGYQPDPAGFADAQPAFPSAGHAQGQPAFPPAGHGEGQPTFPTAGHGEGRPTFPAAGHGEGQPTFPAAGHLQAQAGFSPSGEQMQQFGQPSASNGGRAASSAGHSAADQGWPTPMPTSAGNGPSAPHADIVWPPDGPIPGPQPNAEGSSESGPGVDRRDPGGSA